MAFVVGCSSSTVQIIDNPPETGAGSLQASINKVQPQYREKLKRLLDANVRNPGNPGLLYEIALLYQYSGVADEATNYYKQALQSEPKHVPAAVNLASLYKIRAQPDEAIAVLNELFIAGADDPRARTDLGLLYREKGDLEKSLEQSQYVLKNFWSIVWCTIEYGPNISSRKAL